MRSERMLRSVLLVLASLPWGGCGGPPSTHGSDKPSRQDAQARSVIHRTGFSVGGEEFDAVVHRPEASLANGWGALLIGGGLGNDLDWTTPGSMSIEGQTHRVSISGESHADGPTISGALADRGFVVLRWSTIARGDPLASQWPVRATPRSPGNLLDQSREALETLRGIEGVRADRVVLVGHSLGATRALTIADNDPGVRAVVALAPAYFTSRTPIPSSFTESNMRRGMEVASERKLPVLVLFGSLDGSRVVDAVGLRELAADNTAAWIEVVEYDGLGHQLEPQIDGLHGPIDPAVVQRIGTWLDRLVHREQPSP